LDLLQIFFDPKATFWRLRDRKFGWILPLVAGQLLAIANITLLLRRFSVVSIIEHQMEASGKTLPPGSLDQVVGFAEAMMYVGPLVLGPLMLLLIALVVYGIARGTGGDVRFGQILNVTSISSWAWSAVSTVLSVIMLWLAPDLQSLNLDNPVPLNLGFFLDKASVGAAISALASSVNLLYFYFLWLLALGAAVVADRVRQSTVLWILASIYFLLFFARAGFAMIAG